VTIRLCRQALKFRYFFQTSLKNKMTRLVNGLHNFGLFVSCAAFTTFFHSFIHEHRVESEMEMVEEEQNSTWTHIHLQHEYLARCNNDQCKQEFKRNLQKLQRNRQAWTDYKIALCSYKMYSRAPTRPTSCFYDYLYSKDEE